MIGWIVLALTAYVNPRSTRKSKASEAALYHDICSQSRHTNTPLRLNLIFHFSHFLTPLLTVATEYIVDPLLLSYCVLVYNRTRSVLCCVLYNAVCCAAVAAVLRYGTQKYGYSVAMQC